MLSSPLSAGNNLIAGQTSQHPLRDYWEYLAHMFRRQPPPTDDERMSLGYRDFLQVGRTMNAVGAAVLSTKLGQPSKLGGIQLQVPLQTLTRS